LFEPSGCALFDVPVPLLLVLPELACVEAEPPFAFVPALAVALSPESPDEAFAPPGAAWPGPAALDDAALDALLADCDAACCCAPMLCCKVCENGVAEVSELADAPGPPAALPTPMPVTEPRNENDM
jgi:hypothetical protein